MTGPNPISGPGNSGYILDSFTEGPPPPAVAPSKAKGPEIDRFESATDPASLRAQLLLSIAQGHPEQEIETLRTRLLTLNAPLSATERTNYQRDLTELQTSAAQERADLLLAIAQGDQRKIQISANRLTRLNATHIQFQQFLGVQNPAGITLSATERTNYQRDLTELQEEAARERSELTLAIAQGDQRKIQTSTNRLNRLNATHIQFQQFLGVQNPAGIPNPNP